MFVHKKKIRNLSTNYPYFKPGNNVFFGVPANLVPDQVLLKAGFSIPLIEGDIVLPAKVGVVSKFNSDGKEVIRKDLPKEERVVATREWSWTLWDGTEESRWIDDIRECYKRELVSPPAMELQVITSGDGTKLIVTPQFTIGKTPEETLVHAVNLILELFGSCGAYGHELEGIMPVPSRRLNWTILPKGEIPWVKMESHLQPIINKAPRGNRAFIKERLHTIAEKSPKFCAIGQSGFSGYVIFGFDQKDIYVLESIYYGNATYVFGSDWESLSKITKAEVIQGNLEKVRIIHNTSWWKSMKEFFQKQGI